MKLILLSVIFLGVTSQASADPCYVEGNRLIVGSYNGYVATYDLQTGVADTAAMNMYGRRFNVIAVFEDLGSFEMGQSMCEPTKDCWYLKPFNNKSLWIKIYDSLLGKEDYILTPKVSVGINN